MRTLERGDGVRDRMPRRQGLRDSCRWLGNGRLRDRFCLLGLTVVTKSNWVLKKHRWRRERERSETDEGES